MSNVTERVYNAAEQAKKFVLADNGIKSDIFAKYSLLADVVYGSGGIDLIKNNIETFKPLMSYNVIKWMFTEKNNPLFAKAVEVNPRLGTLFKSEDNVYNVVRKLASDLGININSISTFEEVLAGLRLFGVDAAVDIDEDDIEILDGDDIIDVDVPVNFEDEEYEIEIDEEEMEEEMEQALRELNDGFNKRNVVEKQPQVENKPQVEKQTPSNSGYVEKIHGGYKKAIEDLFIEILEDLYGNHVDGKEVINGFIVPTGAILGDGETIRYEGILTLNREKVEVVPNTISTAIFEEFLNACRAHGIRIQSKVSDNVKDTTEFKYNPMIQREIASGRIHPASYMKGWKEYSVYLKQAIQELAEKLAIKRVETGSDTEIYRALSPYVISIAVVNYKENLGMQLRICCGDTSKTHLVAQTFVNNLRAREKTHKSLAQGKLVVGDPIISDSGYTFTVAVYQNLEGYYAIPQFMGELLYNMKEGMFRPSINRMIIGIDLRNNIVYAPFEKWLVPIIAGSRSGKGVLTLNMLLNVIGCECPLFYLDGKPDISTLFWKLQKKYGIDNAIVIDGVAYKGVTEIDMKDFEAPYYPYIQKALASPTANPILSQNFGLMIYLKTMMVILLATRYYKDVMKSCYGNIFVVFDELYKVMKTQMEIFIMNIHREMSKLGRGEDEKKKELSKIEEWVIELLDTYIGNDIGVFGNGIKAVALTQFAQELQYAVDNFKYARTFCTNFLLKRAVKLFGRQEGGSGTYGVARTKGDEYIFQLYDKYYHFGIGTEQGNTYLNLKTFKPLLVLNENDCKELTGAPEDGAFVKDMLNRISRYMDVEQFRERYFKNRELAESLGFEGALAQVGRLVGKDYRELLRNSLERAYEISDKALRYYNVIGNGELDTVYDYICSFETKHLWTYKEIIEAKMKGRPLVQGVSNENYGEYGTNILINNNADIDLEGDVEDAVDLDLENEYEGMRNIGNNRLNQNIQGGLIYDGVIKDLNNEELNILKDIKNRRVNFQIVDETEEMVEDDEMSQFGGMGIQEEFGADNEAVNTGSFEEYTGFGDSEEVGEIKEDIGNVENEYVGQIRNNQFAYENRKFRQERIDPRPEEDVGAYKESSFKYGGKTGKKLFVNPDDYRNTRRLGSNDYIKVSLEDDNPLEKYERMLFRTIKGSRYEFDKRWKAILNSISRKINPDLITRVLMVDNEMYVNGRLVYTENVLGGFANIRLEDVVNFKELFRKFRNISELTLDMNMVEKFEFEQPNLPQGFFVYSNKLLKVNIIREDGRKEVIDRKSVIARFYAGEEVRKRKQFEAVCASKNPYFKEKSPGYQERIWRATKSFGTKGWSAVSYQLTKKNPSFMKAAVIGLVTTGVVAVGSLIYGISKLFNMFESPNV